MLLELSSVPIGAHHLIPLPFLLRFLDSPSGLRQDPTASRTKHHNMGVHRLDRRICNVPRLPFCSATIFIRILEHGGKQEDKLPTLFRTN